MVAKKASKEVVPAAQDQIVFFVDKEMVKNAQMVEFATQ
jgi:hypothetical protein